MIALALLGVTPARSAQSPDLLAEGFVNPPTAAQPRIWWYWLSGNVAQSGIERLGDDRVVARAAKAVAAGGLR